MRLVRTHSGLLDADRVVAVQAVPRVATGRPDFGPDGAEVSVSVGYAAVAQLAGEHSEHIIAQSDPVEIRVRAARMSGEPEYDFVQRFSRLVQAAQTEGAEAKRAIDGVLTKAKAVLEGDA